MNCPLPARDHSLRSPGPGRAPRPGRAVPCAGTLVSGITTAARPLKGWPTVRHVWPRAFVRLGEWSQVLCGMAGDRR